MKEYFHDIGNTTDLSGINKLKNISRKFKNEIENYLKGEYVYTLFKKTRKKIQGMTFHGGVRGIYHLC